MAGASEGSSFCHLRSDVDPRAHDFISAKDLKIKTKKKLSDFLTFCSCIHLKGHKKLCFITISANI